MITRAIRRSFQHQEGQALVIACMMMLILSIAVLTTVNFGHTVNERVRLQNTADASAYSMATMEARAFNFYSFVNRAQVSHYVAAMVWMSIDSFVFFAEAFVTDLYGLMRTVVYSVASPGVIAVLDTFFPGLGTALKAAKGIVDALGAVPILMQLNVRASGIDRKIGKEIVPAHADLNMALAGMSQAVIASTLRHVNTTDSASMGAGTVALNDSNLGTSNVSQQAVNVVNGCMLDRAHFKEANGTAEVFGTPTDALSHKSVREDDKVARAKRTMGQIANASRFGCDSDTGDDCPDDFVTNRSNARTDKYLKMITVLKGFQAVPVVGSLGADAQTSPKWGQAGMLSYNLARGGIKAGKVMPTYEKGKCQYPPSSDATSETEQNQLRVPINKILPSHPVSSLGQGDNLGADDAYAINMGGLFIKTKAVPFFCGANMDWRRCWGDPRVCDPKNDLGNDGKCLKDTKLQRDPRYMLKSSVWALNDDDRAKGGVHWRVLSKIELDSSGLVDDEGSSDSDLLKSGDTKQQKASQYGLLAYNQGCSKFGLGLVITIYVAAIRPWTATTPYRDGNHKWPGLAPFPHFEPGQFAESCQNTPDASSELTHAAPRTMDFNQPSSFTVLNKSAKQLRNPFGDTTGASHNDPALLNNTGAVTFVFGQGAGQTLSLEDNQVQFMGREGLNVMSRALTYYHRPGDWVEQPNFFNPYWRPRLASVWQGREQLPLVQQYVDTLPDVFRKSPQKVLTH